MSQFGIRAKLCAGKLSIDSSIHAQRPGDFMRRKWRIYGNSDKIACTGSAALDIIKYKDFLAIWQFPAQWRLTNLAILAQKDHARVNKLATGTIVCGTMRDLTIPTTYLVYLGCTTSSTSTHDQERQRKHAAIISHCAAALPGRAPHSLGSQSYH
jgi:hypothetical protein